ncbi:hypothetical protein [Granulicatella seriolae]|uniref:Uncharacterized protein n=1 Tax=Granulicatella seriolae TaxID=2967226 RepID=A0ABT1WPA1_9LACT|nr:hypothetical protein [Granulicatella seriolae]
MSFFKRLFGNKEKEDSRQQIQEQALVTKEIDEENQWRAIPAFIEANPEDHLLVSQIATAIASGDNPKSTFVIKSIKQKNPEATLVSIVAASLAGELASDSHFKVKKISIKK